MRGRLNYANVAATLALVFSMSSGAMAASHYLITSTKQIKPSVLRQLHGQTGATGSQGPPGRQGSKGTPGQKGETGEAGQRGEAGPPGAMGPQGPTGPAGAALWAVVKGDGTLVRGSGAVSAAEGPEPGAYTVVFNRDVSQCAYLATLGSGVDAPPPHGEIGVTGVLENHAAVFVKTLNLKDERTEQSFHLAVFC